MKKFCYLILLMCLALFLIGCADQTLTYARKFLGDAGVYGFTLNEAESEQMQGRLQNPPANRARIYVIVDYAYSGIWSLTSNLKQIKVDSDSIMLKTEAQVKTNTQDARNFGTIKSGIFSVDIVPNGEAIYLYNPTSVMFGLATFGNDWVTKLVPRPGQIHCLSLYQRRITMTKYIVPKNEMVVYPAFEAGSVAWAEKKDCMILAYRVYDDKVEFETENKDEKAKLKAKRVERENELRKERGYKEVKDEVKEGEIKHHSGALTQ